MSERPPTDGLVAGKYRLIRLLGRGGMGSVWEARHEALGNRVAIKFIEGDLLDNPEARGRFETEARAAAQIDSKNAIRVDDYGITPDGKPFIIMEVLEGEGLDKRLQRLGRLTILDTARIVEQVCRALEKAHALGIVHRDLKPENIYLAKKHDEPEEVAKVLDFGIAKIVSGGHPSAKTKTGEMIGTAEFMAPEQARGLDVDYRTDLWAMGVIAFRCITGTLPFSGVGPLDIAVKVLQGPIPVPSQVAPGCPPEFDAWFARAVQRDVSSRFTSARELAESLSTLAGSDGSGAPAPSIRELRHAVDPHGPTIATPGVASTGPGVAGAARPKQQRSTGILFGVLAGGVVVTIVAGYATYSRFSGNGDSPAPTTPPIANATSASAASTAPAPSTVQAPSATDVSIPISALPRSPDHDFVAESCGAILDVVKRLEWYVGPDQDTSWDEAHDFVNDLTSCGGGWRLPTRDELAALYDPTKTAGTGFEKGGVHYPAKIDPVFAIGGGSWVWSSSAIDATRAVAYNLFANAPVTLTKIGSAGDPASPSVRAFAVRTTTAGVAVELAPDDRGFVDTTGGAGWGNRCWAHLQSGQLGWAKAECDRAMAMNPAAPQPRASVLFNLGLIEQRTGHAEAARTYYLQSLALRENSDVRASLKSIDR